MVKVLMKLGAWLSRRPRVIWNRFVNPDQIRRSLVLDNDLKEETIRAAQLKNARSEIDLRVHAARKQRELAHVRRRRLPRQPERT